MARVRVLSDSRPFHWGGKSVRVREGEEYNGDFALFLRAQAGKAAEIDVEVLHVGENVLAREEREAAEAEARTLAFREAAKAKAEADLERAMAAAEAAQAHLAATQAAPEPDDSTTEE